MKLSKKSPILICVDLQMGFLLAKYLWQLGLPYLSVSIILSSASAIGFGS